MHHKNSWIQFSILTLLVISALWFLNNSFASNEQMYLKLDKGLFYLKQVYETVSRNYVDEVDPEGLSKSAINGIVNELDPYTVFFERKGSERLEMITTGKYGGLGMEISRQNNYITVIAPIDDTPAKRAGIRAGDIISKIDYESAEGMSLDDASSKLRGRVGTEVTLEIKRPGREEPITLVLIRQEIIIKDVSYSDFIEPGIAFFRMTSFSDKAASELRHAIRDVQQKGVIENVILDLRGNPGGLLASSIEVSNIFIPRGELIVKTKGNHEREAEYTTAQNAILPDVPLIVLVDGGSASASEIVSGAVQDLDRGVIIGTKTFGKGLVQQVYSVDKINDAFIKITTAKYYIPSGRCIQREDYKKNKEIYMDLADSTEIDNHKKYYTKNRRVVYGNGGITPDIEVKIERTDPFIISLWAGGHFFNFAVDYLSKHPEIKADNGFTVTEDIIDNFRNYINERSKEIPIDGENQLKDFLEIAQEENYDPDLVDLITVSLQKLEIEKKNEFEQNINDIKQALEVEFAEKLGGTKTRIATTFKYDETLNAALKILKNQEKYQQILAIEDK
jgi:carboxyl-terminal processing protease